MRTVWFAATETAAKRRKRRRRHAARKTKQNETTDGNVNDVARRTGPAESDGRSRGREQRASLGGRQNRRDASVPRARASSAPLVQTRPGGSRARTIINILLYGMLNTPREPLAQAAGPRRTAVGPRARIFELVVFGDRGGGLTAI